jgi:hypothetical protein
MQSRYTIVSLFLLISSSLFAQTQTGEVLVTTDPEEAQVFVGEERVGTSPILLTELPPGELLVEARLEGFHGTGQVRVVAGEIAKLHIELQGEIGRIYIRQTQADLILELDGERIGAVGDGLVEDVVVGQHLVELSGDGLYGKIVARVEANQTVTVTPEIHSVGTIRYALPADATASLNGDELESTVAGTGRVLNAPVGTVTAEISRPGYVNAQISLVVEQGKQTLLEPVLEPDEVTTAEQERKELARRLELTEATRSRLVRELAASRVKYANMSVAGWILVGTGGTAFAGSIVTAVLSLLDEFVAEKETLGGVALGLGVFGGITSVVGTMVWLERSDPVSIEEELRRLEKKE